MKNSKKTTKKQTRVKQAASRRFDRRLLTVSLLLTVAAIALIAPIYYFKWQDAKAIASNDFTPVSTQAVVAKPTTVSGNPKVLTVPSLSMRLDIAEGRYDAATGQWTLSLDKVHYAVMTVQPNDEQGNTFIYGHYRPGVFAMLHRIKPGAEAVIETDNGLRFVYTYTGNSVLNPTDTSVFAYQGPPKLTLQTCTGTWMQNRQLFSFDYVRYEKIQ
jgi:sortase (surface protein transpeptidase)